MHSHALSIFDGNRAGKSNRPARTGESVGRNGRPQNGLLIPPSPNGVFRLAVVSQPQFCQCFTVTNRWKTVRLLEFFQERTRAVMNRLIAALLAFSFLAMSLRPFPDSLADAPKKLAPLKSPLSGKRRPLCSSA